MYLINREIIRKGVEELMKFRINEIRSHGGSLGLATTVENYLQTEQLALRFGVDVREYRREVGELTDKTSIPVIGTLTR